MGIRGFIICFVNLVYVLSLDRVLGQYIPKEELRNKTTCDLKINLDITCGSDGVIVIQSFYFYYHPDCETTCCGFDSTHYKIGADSNDITTVRRLCSGRTDCSLEPLEGIRDFGVEAKTLNSSYVVIYHYCIPESRITSCTGSNLVSAGEPIYLTSNNYPFVATGDSSCTCSVEVFSCTSRVNSYIIDADMYLDQVNCEQNINFLDGRSTSLDKIDCRSFSVNEIVTKSFATNYIKIDFIDNSDQNQEGFFLLGFGVSEETAFKLSCSFEEQTVCMENGGWSDWSGWGSCSSSCGDGIRNRTRSCTNPHPLYGGAQCLGNSVQSEYCRIGYCPINGNWSPWSDWNICSRTCGGGGYQSRYRSCDNPYPQYGGLVCTGDSTEIKTCGAAECPVNGAWGSWEAWLQCSHNCGLGTQTRYRYCDSPVPQNGGKTCTGRGLETTDCFGNNCPINGQWGDWTSWTNCSTKCGSGTYSRYRECDSPAPKNGGQICSGNSYENGQCSIGVCIDDEAWSPWSPWSSCSKSCGEGKVSRTRDCYSPEPNHVGNSCLGDSNESVSCILRKCAVNGNWGIWSPWSFCSITCGPGSISRIRECNSPGPENGGNSCYGESSEEISCFMLPCPVDGGFGPWSPWSKCSASCGIGEKSRLRECNNPVPANGGKYCSDLDFQSSVCNVTKCPGTGQTTSSQAGFSSETPVTQASVDKKKKEDDSNMGAIIGGTVGGLLLLLLLLLLLVCFIRRRRRKEVKRRPSEGDRSVRYISQGDDVTVTENQLYNYDGETPSHAVNALFVGGIPETPQSPGYIPHFSTDTGDRYAVIMDSNRTKPKTKERPKLDTFNSQEENAKAEPNGDVRASTDTVKLAENYNDDQLGRGVDNPGYEDSYIAPYDSAEGETKPKTSSSSPSPYDYIDNEKLKRDDADFEDDKLAGDYATLPDDGNEVGDNDAENNERYKRFISSEPEESADDGYLKSPKRDNVFEFPDTS